MSHHRCVSVDLDHAASDPAHQHEDEQDDDNKSKAARRTVSPSPGMPPGGQRADEGEDQDDEKDRAEGHGVHLLEPQPEWGGTRITRDGGNGSGGRRVRYSAPTCASAWLMTTTVRCSAPYDAL